MKTFLILSYLATCIFAVDYCTISVCPPGEHIACNNDGKLASTCPKDTEIIKFTPTVIEAVVGTFNELRNQLAGGKLPGYEPAARMATIRWEPELAEIASFNVYACKLWHDECRNTEKFSIAGQNVFGIVYLQTESVESTFIKHTKLLFDEYKHASMNDIDKGTYADGIGHFIAMANDVVTGLGCAAVMYPNEGFDGWNAGYFTCNYGNLKYLGVPIYNSSDIPASDCKEKNPDYPNLCSLDEVYECQYNILSLF